MIQTGVEKALRVALLTGGSDKPYAIGLSTALAAQNIFVEFIGSDELDTPEVTRSHGIAFCNLRGDTRDDVPVLRKVLRILTYYGRLVLYSATTQSQVFHILWNNKFEVIDRTALMCWYRLLGKRIVLTAHNVNVAKRDSRDSWLNRVTLRFQYQLCDQIFVHTDRMKRELVEDFGVSDERATVIPFGINETIPLTGLTPSDAKRGLGLSERQPALLFFGQIAPYKGLKDLVLALAALARSGRHVHLVIAGKVKRGWEAYWSDIQQLLAANGLGQFVTTRVCFVPDAEIEQYFKAADAIVVPYRDIFQSGVPFLAYSFGLPVIATDVGSFRDVVREGVTGTVCAPGDPAALSEAIERYFRSDLYAHLDSRRDEIRRWATEKYSWTTVGEITRSVYEKVLVKHVKSHESRVVRS